MAKSFDDEIELRLIDLRLKLIEAEANALGDPPGMDPFIPNPNLRQAEIIKAQIQELEKHKALHVVPSQPSPANKFVPKYKIVKARVHELMALYPAKSINDLLDMVVDETGDDLDAVKSSYYRKGKNDD